MNSGYLTYPEFVDFGGSRETVSLESFERAEFCARTLLDRHTCGRIRALGITPVVKRLMYELVLLETGRGERGVTSFSQDGVSVGFAGDGEYAAAQTELILNALSRERLSDGTPLLWRGISR